MVVWLRGRLFSKLDEDDDKFLQDNHVCLQDDLPEAREAVYSSNCWDSACVSV